MHQEYVIRPPDLKVIKVDFRPLQFNLCPVMLNVMTWILVNCPHPIKLLVLGFFQMFEMNTENDINLQINAHWVFYIKCPQHKLFSDINCIYKATAFIIDGWDDVFAILKSSSSKGGYLPLLSKVHVICALIITYCPFGDTDPWKLGWFPQGCCSLRCLSTAKYNLALDASYLLHICSDEFTGAGVIIWHG